MPNRKEATKMEKSSNREVAIKELKQQEENLLDQIKALQTDYDAIKRARDFLSQSGDQTSFLSTSTLVKTNEFAKMKVSEAILKILNDSPTKEFRPNEITRILERGGIKTKSKNFLNIVTSTLLRLAKKEKSIEQMQIQGIRGSRYKAKAA
jgi:hypothetical protein